MLLSFEQNKPADKLSFLHWLNPGTPLLIHKYEYLCTIIEFEKYHGGLIKEEQKLAKHCNLIYANKKCGRGKIYITIR